MKASARGEQTRKRIVDVATCLFTQNGYRRTSLSQILEATGLTKGGFYFHFKTKEDLGFAVVESLERCWNDEIAPRLDACQTAPQKITTLLAGGCDCHRREGSRPFVLLMTLAAETLVRNDRITERVRQVFGGWRRTIADVIEDGKAEGHFRDDTDALGLAGVILSTILGGNLQALLNGRPEEYENQLHCLQQLLLRALSLEEMK